MNNILIVVAHLDDETLGMYGTIQKLQENNNIIIYVMCKGRDKKNSDERLKVIFNLYKHKNIDIIVDEYYDLTLNQEPYNIIADKIRKTIIENNIDTVYTNAMDLHFEHCIINKCTKVASRNIIKKLYEIYIPVSSDIKQFTSEYIVKIDLKEKIKACQKYKTEINKNTINKIKRFNQYIGSKYNKKSAELFNVVFIKK